VPEDIVSIETEKESKLIKSDVPRKIRELAGNLLKGRPVPLSMISTEDKKMLEYVSSDEAEAVKNIDRISSILNKFYNHCKSNAVKRGSNINLVKRIILLNPGLPEEYRKILSDFVLDEEKAKTINISEILQGLPKGTLFVDPIVQEKNSKPIKNHKTITKNHGFDSEEDSKATYFEKETEKMLEKTEIKPTIMQLIVKKIEAFKQFFVLKKLFILDKRIKKTKNKLDQYIGKRDSCLFKNVGQQLVSDLLTDLINDKNYMREDHFKTTCTKEDVDIETFNKYTHICSEAILANILKYTNNIDKTKFINPDESLQKTI